MKLTLHIRRRTQQEWLVWAFIVFPFLFGGLIELAHLPNMVKYSLDISWVALLVLICLNHKNPSLGKEKALLRWAIVFILYTLILCVFRYQSIFYYLWGARNNFRYYIFFFACTMFLSPRTVEKFLDYFDIFFWVNAVVTMIQYVFLGFRGDFLGGVFGTTAGVNQYTNILLVISVSKSILLYLDKKESLTRCVSKFVLAAIIAALAELKVFFVEAVIIIGAAMLITNFSWRKLGIVIGGGVCILGGASILTQLFADGDITSMSIENLLAIVTSDQGYTSSGDLNRLTAIMQINNQIFDDWHERIFGLGLGNCDTSSFAICNTPFFQKYSYLNYTWFSMPMMYLETGYIGLVFFFGFFVLCWLKARKKLKEDSENKFLYQMGMIMSLICCMLALYNSSLRTEAGYMAYFILALPFINMRPSRLNFTEE